MKTEILTLALLTFAFGCGGGANSTVKTSAAPPSSALGASTGALVDSTPSEVSPRIYMGSASVGGLFRITVDPQSQALTFSDVSTNTAETVSYVMAADGSATLTDQSGHVSAVYENPDGMMVALVDNAGPNHDQIALITATQAQDVAGSTFAGKSYNSIRFKATNGGVAIGSLAIDNNGEVTGTEYATYPGFTWLSFQLPGGAPSPYLTIPATGSSVSQYGYGSADGLFVLDSQQGTSISMPKGSSKLFDKSWAGTYSLLYYQKTNAKTESTGGEEGSVRGGIGQVTVDPLGNLVILDGEGNQVSGSLQPIADDLDLYDQRPSNNTSNAGQFADPCFGMFTLHISADASGRPVSEDVFVSFRRGAVVLALFSTAAPISPVNPYNYLYGIGIAEPNSYIRSGISSSGPASTWSAPPNSGGGASSSTGGTVAVGTALLGISGAKHDGVTDDTAAIQAAFNSSHDITFTDGVYLINADGLAPSSGNGNSNSGGVTPQSNTVIHCTGGAVLQAKTSSLTGYNVLRLNQVSNVHVIGCSIMGDRGTHKGTTGEWGYGIGIWGSTDILLEDVTVSNCWGDGIYIDRALYPSTGYRSQRINGKNVVSTNNRRQGMSIIDGLDIVFRDSYFLNTNGTAPQAGIDIEPGGFGNAVAGFQCIGCEFSGNSGRGFMALSTTLDDLVNEQLIGGSSHDNGDAGVSASHSVKSMLVDGMFIHDNGGPGLWAIDVPDGGLTFTGNNVSGNGRAGNPVIGQANIQVQTSTGVVISKNVVRAGANTALPTYGINLNTDASTLVSGNDLQTSGATGDVLNYSGTGNIVTGNLLTGNAPAPIAGAP